MASLECAASSEACPPRPAPCHAREPLRIVLVGKTGTGRSSAGNTILGREAFPAGPSPRSLTSCCRTQEGTAAAGGRRLSVTDTPGFLHTRLSPREVVAAVRQGVLQSPPGPHVFLLTVRTGRFTQEDRRALGWLRAALGPAVTRFTLLLLTWGDELRRHGAPVDDFLAESAELTETVARCLGGVHVLDNGGGANRAPSSSPRQVETLLEKVERLVAGNGGGFYGSEMLREADEALREAQERVAGDEGGGDVVPRAGVRGQQEPGKREEEEEEEEEQEGEEEERRREEEAVKKKADKVFWCELVTALGRGAAEGAGVTGKDRSTGKALKKMATMATTPLSITSAAKVVGGVVREGGKVIYKHRKSLLH